MSRKQVAALVGVAPYAFESGRFKGRRCIWGGRAPVRNALYMGAMSASNWKPPLRVFHDRLKAAGKLPKVVIVAIMRKMITRSTRWFATTLFGPTIFPDGTVCRPHGSHCAD